MVPVGSRAGWFVWVALRINKRLLTDGGIVEVAGYAGRLAGALQDPGCWTMGPYIIQSILILIAPALMAASIYMILGRIILLTEGEVHSLVRREWLTKTFVLGDVLSFLMQSGGEYNSPSF